MDEINANVNPGEIRIRLIKNRNEAIGIYSKLDVCNSHLACIPDIYYSPDCTDEVRSQLVNSATELQSRIQSLKKGLLEISKVEVNDYGILQNVVNKKKNLAASVSALPQFRNATIDSAVHKEAQSIMEYQIIMAEIQNFLAEINSYLSETNPTDTVKSYGQKTL